jgi:hypothetical protein
MWSIGDRVLARWPVEVSWYYPGTVCGAQEDGYVVQFDDGDRALVVGEEMRYLDIEVGEQVFGRWQAGRLYFPGTVTDQRGWALHIQYDDGDAEWTSVCMIRVAGLRPPTPEG